MADTQLDSRQHESLNLVSGGWLACQTWSSEKPGVLVGSFSVALGIEAYRVLDVEQQKKLAP